MIFRLLTTIAAAVFWASSACALTLVFEDELLLVLASASPNSSFVGGIGNSTLTIDQSSGDFGGDGVSHALIRFLDYAVPSTSVIQSARLEFYTTDNTPGPVDVYQMTTDWGATSTWNSFGGDGVTPGAEAAAAPTGSLTGSESFPEMASTAFDVTPALLAWRAGASEFGFGVINTSSDGWDISTVDDDPRFAPRLVVEVVTPAPAKLQIDPNSGSARFVSVVSGMPIELRSYEILSDAGTLDPAAWQATNLDARNVDAADPPAIGDRWDTVAATPIQLFEANLLGGSTLAPEATLSIGKIMAPIGGMTPPTLGVTLVTTNFLGGADEFNSFDNVIVEYASFGATPGDYNLDGAVDAADYTVWRDTLGQLGPGLPADGDGDNAVDPDDYQVWKLNFGAGAPLTGALAATRSSAVSEPAAAKVAALAGVGVMVAMTMLRSRGEAC